MAKRGRCARPADGVRARGGLLWGLEGESAALHNEVNCVTLSTCGQTQCKHGTLPVRAKYAFAAMPVLQYSLLSVSALRQQFS